MSHIKLAADLRRSLGRARRKMTDDNVKDKGKEATSKSGEDDAFAPYDRSNTERKRAIARASSAQREKKRGRGKRSVDPVIAKEKGNKAKRLLFPASGKVTTIVSLPALGIAQDYTVWAKLISARVAGQPDTLEETLVVKRSRNKERLAALYRARIFNAVATDDVEALSAVFSETQLGINAGVFAIDRQKPRPSDHSFGYAHDTVPDFHAGHTGTCLHLAACIGSLESARWLLARGADPLKKDVDGRTPTQLTLGDEMKLVFSLKEQASEWRRDRFDDSNDGFGEDDEEWNEEGEDTKETEGGEAMEGKVSGEAGGHEKAEEDEEPAIVWAQAGEDGEEEVYEGAQIRETGKFAHGRREVGERKKAMHQHVEKT